MSTEPAKEEVNHPSRYNAGKVECIDAIESALTPEEYRGFIKGTVLRYVWREKHKGGNQDFEKAAWYTNRLLEYSAPAPSSAVQVICSATRDMAIAEAVANWYKQQFPSGTAMAIKQPDLHYIIARVK